MKWCAIATQPNCCILAILLTMSTQIFDMRHRFVSHPFPKEGKGWGTHIRFQYVVSMGRGWATHPE